MALGRALRRAASSSVETRGRMLDTSEVTITADGATTYRTHDRMLTIPVVYAGVARIAEAFRVMPLELKLRALGHWRTLPENLRLVELLCEAPNPEMSSGEVFELLTAWKILRGNGYLFKQRDAIGRVVNLWPIPPTRVEPRRDPETGLKVFDVSRSSDDPVDLPGLCTPSDLMHFRGFGIDPLRGLGAVEAQRLLAERTSEEEQYQSRQLKQMVRPSGVIEAPGAVSPVAEARVAEGFKKTGVPVLPDGWTWKGVSLSAADAEFVKARNMTRQEWAMVLRLPPSMLLTDTGGTMHYDSATMDGQFFVTHTMLPWIGRFQDGLRNDPDLPWGTTGRTKGRLYPVFNTSAYLRADDLTRAKAAVIAQKWTKPSEQRDADGLPYDASFDAQAKAAATTPAPDGAPEPDGGA